jgi:hypothetical protein
MEETLQNEREARQKDRARRMQRIVNAYHRVFRSPDGELVLADLTAAFGFNLPTFLATGTKPGEIKYNRTYAAIRDGQRQVYLHIQTRLDTPVRGDADFDLPVNIIKTGLTPEAGGPVQ